MQAGSDSGLSRKTSSTYLLQGRVCDARKSNTSIDRCSILKVHSPDAIAHVLEAMGCPVHEVSIEVAHHGQGHGHCNSFGIGSIVKPNMMFAIGIVKSDTASRADLCQMRCEGFLETRRDMTYLTVQLDSSHLEPHPNNNNREAGSLLLGTQAPIGTRRLSGVSCLHIWGHVVDVIVN